MKLVISGHRRRIGPWYPGITVRTALRAVGAIKIGESPEVRVNGKYATMSTRVSESDTIRIMNRRRRFKRAKPWPKSRERRTSELDRLERRLARRPKIVFPTTEPSERWKWLMGENAGEG